MKTSLTPTELIYKTGSVGLETSHENEFVVQWMMTRECNYKCRYCGNWNKDPHKMTHTIVPTSSIVNLIRSVNSDRTTVTLLGGEPTLLGHRLIETIEDLNSTSKDLKKLTICIFINLSSDLEFLGYLLKSMNEKNVLLCSYHPRLCDINEFKEKLRFLQNNTIPYKVNIMMEDGEMSKVIDMMEFCKSLGVGKQPNIGYECVRALGDLSQNDYLQYRKECNDFNSMTHEDEKMDVYYDILDIRTKSKERYVYNHGNLKMLADSMIKFRGIHCKRYSHINIDFDGTITPRCDEYESKREIICNLMDDDAIKKISATVFSDVKCPNRMCQRCDMLCIPKFRRLGVESDGD